ncbi:cryptochrome DASH, chloroplastic/mitochondrial [Mercurialis annua]|uniref:cryptochrome DASH, chloroplastic/mitochondrial n=1 Tax=Mercurialis annua TaxID=3986 RepID=UPI0021609F4C|nr:cryptochrome DASH, chloroplastic/mitochondrial [Mercurialis annua]
MAFLSRPSLQKLISSNIHNPSKPTDPIQITRTNLSRIMNSTSSSSSSSSLTFQVPAASDHEMERIVAQTFENYSTKTLKKKGNKGTTAIVWFRNDLRILDNECLVQAWISSEYVLPVYCVDPRLFQTTHQFAFPKTGALRAQFIMECLADLKKNLMKRGLNLLIRHGKPEDVIPSLAQAFAAHAVYAQKETCSEELNVEKLLSKALYQVKLPPSPNQSNKGSTSITPKLHLVWGTTMYHIDDLPFSATNLPDLYTQFRKSVEAKCAIRGCVKIPTSLAPPPPTVDDWGCVPSVDQLGLQPQQVDKGMKFLGGESAALSRVYEYFWKKDLLKNYKETRNGMLGPDYSTKFSPWMASGSLSLRFIHEEVKRYEKERQANDSTYWVLFELTWRDHFRFLSIKYGNLLFHLGGPRKLEHEWSQDQRLFESWRDGCTGYPLIDANMKELSTTGFMSNRGRQIVCSFLVRDMGIDWRMGAEWFESCLLDYDPCSNYGNWTYGAGVGTDPREDRYFSIPKQAQNYDPEGEYVAYWLPQLKKLEKDKRHIPGKTYIEQIVPLKYGNFRQNNYGGRQRKGFKTNRF